MYVGDLARLLNCSEKHVRVLIQRGSVPGVVRLGRLVRLNRQAITAWLSHNCPPVGPHADHKEVANG